MSALAGLAELTDWAGDGVTHAPLEPFEAGDLGSPSEALAQWVGAATPGVTSFGGLASPVVELAAGLVAIAGRSGTTATWIGELVLDEFAERSLGAAESDLVAAGADAAWPRIRCGIESPHDDGPRRWVLAPPGAPGAVVVVPGAARSRAFFVDDLAPSARGGMIGLDGLEVYDLGDAAGAGVVDPALGRDATDALVALGAIVDAAVDLGICIGFVCKVAEYVTVTAGDPSTVEVAALERLGEAYAVLAALSEGLAELAAAPAEGPRPGDLRLRAGTHRALLREQGGALLSDLFEIAGARATSGRFGLDRPWRDFIARQAVHPIAGVLPPTRQEN
jgi:hypothetical protein